MRPPAPDRYVERRAPCVMLRYALSSHYLAPVRLRVIVIISFRRFPASPIE